MKKIYYLFLFSCLFLVACSESKKVNEKNVVDQTVLMP